MTSGNGSATATATGGAGRTGGNGGTASGGGTPGTGGDGGLGGNATTSSMVVTGAGGNATVTATANAGTGGNAGNNGGNAGNGGTASLGTISGTSDTGTVTVTGTLNGGDGGSATGSGNAGSGQNVAITDKVDGSTTGTLNLRQVVTGGNSGAVDTGVNGTAGTAFSSLTKSSSSSFLDVESDATGGAGGERDDTTGTAAAGGSAEAIAAATNDAGEARANWTFGGSDAQGGAGGLGRNGAGGGAGGDATQTATAATVGDFIARTNGAAVGGSGGSIVSGNDSLGGAGGDALSTSTASSTGDGFIDNRDFATGGAGGGVSSGTGTGGAGGNATSNANGSNAGATQSVGVSATATGGTGGQGIGATHSGGAGGDATLGTVTGSSSGGAAVSVTGGATGGTGGRGLTGADGGAGGNAALANALSGSTSGTLTLNQTSTGGTGGAITGGGTAGNGGNADATLAASNTGGGTLNSTATVNAGNGGAATNSGTAGDGGTVGIGVGTGTVSGTSASGGTVNVTAAGNGGNGGGAATGTADAGGGSSVALVDIVDGSTSGALNLTQNVTGGDSGSVQDGASGTAGSASSSLTKDVTSDATKPSALSADTDAFGGNGGTRNAASGVAAAGADGTASSTAINNGGTALAQTDARGGTGGLGQNGADGGAGGDSFSTAVATTSGDGNTVTARGFAGFASNNGGAITSGTGSTGGAGGAGGTATGSSTATALGNSFATANDDARGGTGGSVFSGTGTGGAGGAALSNASASNAGSLSVSATAFALGGNGGTGRGAGQLAGAGGDATATATGSGDGVVSVRADADGGNPGTVADSAGIGLGGNGFATATGTGTNGSVIADATVGISNGWLVNDLLTTAATSLFDPSASNTNVAHARAQLSGAGFDTSVASGQQATALGYGAPADDVSLPLVFGNAVHANFDISGIADSHIINNSAQLNSDVFGIGVLGGSYSTNGSGNVRTYSSVADFDVDLSQLQTGNQNLVVGFMNPVIKASSFSDPDFSVRFHITNEGSTVVDQTFTDEAAALNFFSGNTIDLGAVTTDVSGDMDIRFLLDVTSDNPGSGMAVDYVFGNTTVTPRAVPYVPDTTVDIGDAHVGDVTLQGVEVRNAAIGTSDGADAQFTGTTGDATTNGGTITGLAPTGSDPSSMQVGVDTSTSGAKSGTATIQLDTDGTVTGNNEVFGSAEVTINGDVYAFADPTINNAPVAFGNVRVGDIAAQALSISNNAANDGFSENLNASADGTTGGVTSTGSFNGLGPQQTDTSSVSVGIDTGSAGNKDGNATIDFVSDGTGINSLGQTTLASQDVNVTGNVFRLAEAGAHSPEPVVLANVHVGDTAQQALSMTNTAASDGFSESLNASLGAATGDATASGSFSLLGAGDTDSSSLVVGVDTATAGAKSGTAIINSESDGTGTSAIVGNVALADQTVNVSGNVYTAAVAQVVPTTIDFGVVHIGDVIGTQSLQVSNIAPVTALNDVLLGSFGDASGPFTASGDLGAGLAAGQTENSSMVAGLDTSSAGGFNDTATVSLASHNDDMTDLMLDDVNIMLMGQVNNFADAAFDFISGDGALTGGDTSYLLDFGNIVQGSGVLEANLGLINDVLAPADLLAGTFDLGLAGSDFDLLGFDSFGLSGAGFDPLTALNAGDFINDLFISFDTTLFAIGDYSGSLVLNSTGFNVSGFEGDLDPVTLAFSISVVDGTAVPEPGIWMLFLPGLILIFAVRCRRRQETL